MVVSRRVHLFLVMDETGQKITKVFEFLDSKGTEVLRGLMKRARANEAKAKGREVSKTSFE